MLLFLEVKKYLYVNGHIVSILSLKSLLTHAFFCLLSCCDQRGGRIIFDVCIVERTRFREEETSEQMRCLLLGSCRAPRAVARLGSTRSEVDDKTLYPPPSRK